MSILRYCETGRKGSVSTQENGEGTGSSRTNNLQKWERISEFMFAVMIKLERIKHGSFKWKHYNKDFTESNLKHVHRTKWLVLFAYYYPPYTR